MLCDDEQITTLMLLYICIPISTSLQFQLTNYELMANLNVQTRYCLITLSTLIF